MNIFSRDFSAPSQLQSKEFVLFFTDLQYVKPDHEAVMKSRESLRIYSQSTWPEDDFTEEQNREDLQNHIDDNKNHEAYGYMIFSPDRKRCLGSLYVNPLTPLSKHYLLSEEEVETLRRYDARIDFWLSDDVDFDLTKTIFSTVREWLGREWKINPLYSARREMINRQKLYETVGLELRADLHGHESDVNLLLFSELRDR